MGLANRRLQSCAPATAIEEEVEATQALLAKLCVQLEAAPSDAALAILRAYKEKLQESIKAMVPQTRLLELPAELLVVVIQQLLNTGDGACGALWPSSSSPPWPDGSSRTPYPRDLSSAVERGYRRVGRLAQYRTVRFSCQWVTRTPPRLPRVLIASAMASFVRFWLRFVPICALLL